MKKKMSFWIHSALMIAVFLAVERLLPDHAETIFRYLIGGLMIGAGVWGLIRRIAFHLGEKDFVVGELIRLEETIDSEGAVSYTPYYRCVYHDEVKEYKSDISSFTFKRLEIGSKTPLLISRKHPDQMVVQNMDFHLLYYLVVFVVIGGGFFLIFMK